MSMEYRLIGVAVLFYKCYFDQGSQYKNDISPTYK